MEKRSNEYAAICYNEIAENLAKIVVDLRELENRAKWISEEMTDNGDPHFALSDTVRYAGIALAEAMTYAMEYRKDAAKEKNKKSK